MPKFSGYTEYQRKTARLLHVEGWFMFKRRHPNTKSFRHISTLGNKFKVSRLHKEGINKIESFLVFCPLLPSTAITTSSSVISIPPWLVQWQMAAVLSFFGSHVDRRSYAVLLVDLHDPTIALLGSNTCASRSSDSRSDYQIIILGEVLGLSWSRDERGRAALGWQYGLGCTIYSAASRHCQISSARQLARVSARGMSSDDSAMAIALASTMISNQTVTRSMVLPWVVKD
ncbi:hypothetical protein C8J56DRAFT_879625 [Mycena floridula]|nr:hypothetical protein C8J56DRAFT_879625 [Mycena floridula]